MVLGDLPRIPPRGGRRIGLMDKGLLPDPAPLSLGMYLHVALPQDA